MQRRLYAREMGTVQLIARASEHCVIRSIPCNVTKQCILTILLDSSSVWFYLRQTTFKKAACLREGDYEAGHVITHVQTHVQSTVTS